MLVRFDTKAAAGVSMFEKDARQMIALMGHSDTIPSAIRAADVAQALQIFQANLDKAAQQEQGDHPHSEDESKDEEPPVPINRRAWPLQELLKAAVAKQAIVSWDFDHNLL